MRSILPARKRLSGSHRTQNCYAHTHRDGERSQRRGQEEEVNSNELNTIRARSELVPAVWGKTVCPTYIDLRVSGACSPSAIAAFYEVPLILHI
jgi:hypothetical protein